MLSRLRRDVRAGDRIVGENWYVGGLREVSELANAPSYTGNGQYIRDRHNYGWERMQSRTSAYWEVFPRTT